MPEPEYHEFVIRYRHEGAEWLLKIKARDWQDAEARLQSLAWGTVEGVLHAEIPAGVPGAGLWVRLLCWWRNLRTART